MGKDYFEITTRSEPHYHVVSLKGVLDAASEIKLSQTLETLCQSECPHIVIDCGQLSYMNSATFGLFFHYHRQCESRNGRLVLCRISSKIQSILKLLGLHQVLNVRSSIEDALQDVPAVESSG